MCDCVRKQLCLDREEPVAVASCWQEEKPSEETQTHTHTSTSITSRQIRCSRDQSSPLWIHLIFPNVKYKAEKGWIVVISRLVLVTSDWLSHLQALCVCSGQNKNTLMSKPAVFHSLWCITVNTEIPPEWAQRWGLIYVSPSWVNMMMWTVINSSSYHLWAWGTGLFMATVHTFISPGCWGFYLYGSPGNERKCYYTQDIFSLILFSPPTNEWGKNPNEMPCKWTQMDCRMCVHV